MAYIGTAPTAGQYRKLDNISSSFNGSTTTFTTQVGGQNVSAGTPSQLLVSLGGVIQQPTTDYTVSTNSLTFVTAPASGLSFFAILMGDALSVGTPADGSVSTAKLADAAVTTAKLASGLTVDLTSGSAAAPSLTFDANTGLYSPAEDTIGFVEGGVEAARIDSSGRLLVGTSSARNIQTHDAKFQTEGVGYNNSTIQVIGNGNNVDGAYLFIGKSRGTSVGSNTVVQNNDDLGEVRFYGADGTGMIPGAQIKAQVDGTPGTNDMPGRLVFATTADGASSPTARLTIKADGAFRDATGVYLDATGSAANMFINSSGFIQRSTSSAKYKTDIEPLEDQYSDALLNCRPVWYRSTCVADNPDWGWWGFIAEEVAEIDPRLVHWKTTEPVVQENGSLEHVPCDPEPEGVAYDRFVPHLLNLIKRQGEAIADLQAEVAALKAQ